MLRPTHRPTTIVSSDGPTHRPTNPCIVSRIMQPFVSTYGPTHRSPSIPSHCPTYPRIVPRALVSSFADPQILVSSHGTSFPAVLFPGPVLCYCPATHEQPPGLDEPTISIYALIFLRYIFKDPKQGRDAAVCARQRTFQASEGGIRSFMGSGRGESLSECVTIRAIMPSK